MEMRVASEITPDQCLRLAMVLIGILAVCMASGLSSGAIRDANIDNWVTWPGGAHSKSSKSGPGSVVIPKEVDLNSDGILDLRPGRTPIGEGSVRLDWQIRTADGWITPGIPYRFRFAYDRVDDGFWLDAGSDRYYLGRQAGATFLHPNRLTLWVRGAAILSVPWVLGDQLGMQTDRRVAEWYMPLACGGLSIGTLLWWWRRYRRGAHPAAGLIWCSLIWMALTLIGYPLLLAAEWFWHVVFVHLNAPYSLGAVSVLALWAVGISGFGIGLSWIFRNAKPIRDNLLDAGER